MSRVARWLVLAVVAAGMSGAAVAQIKNTRHNLGSTNTFGAGAANFTSNTAEVCVFCHTPHGGDVTTVGAPLWNKRLDTAAVTYTTYSSSTMEAQKATDGTAGIGSVSLPCLSCHDGTQAMDNILNSPGSGGFSATGGGDNGLAFAWGTSPGVDANGIMTSGAALGSDLSNDHPIGIQYCGGGPGTTTPAAACNDPEFVTPQNAGGVFWVDTTGGTPGTKEKTDMILFNRTFALNPNGGAAGTYPSVECATCHDPHSATNPTFLRTSNAGSAVCLACHTK